MAVNPNTIETVKLNVGGVVFETTLGTLTKLFCRESAGLQLPFPSRDRNGAYFIDRDPKYFVPILNYIRTGTLLLDKEVNPAGVIAEADYFGLRIEHAIDTQTRSEIEFARLETENKFQALNLEAKKMKLEDEKINAEQKKARSFLY